MRYLAALAAAIAYIPCAFSILSDEAYKIDYHHALIGIPQSHSTFFHRPQADSSASLLYTISNDLVLGAVNPKDGSVVWRQAVDIPKNSANASYLVAAEGDSSVISAAGNVVSGWDGLSGQLNWQYRAPTTQHAVSLATTAPVESPRGADAVVLFGKEQGIVRRLDAVSGKVKWDFVDSR